MPKSNAASALLERSDTAKHGKRLTDEQKARILALTAEGQTQVRIAEAIGCTQQTVSDVIIRFADTRELALKELYAKALPNIRSWHTAIQVAAKKGDHRPAKEAVEAAMPELRPQQVTGSTQIAIVVGQPGAPVQLPSGIAKPDFRPTLSPAIDGESRAVSD